MKNFLFFFAFVLLSLPAFSQNEYVVDTAQTVKIGDLFYKDNYLIREDGTGQIPERSLIGDSATYSRHQLALYVTASRQWAALAYEASQVGKLYKKLNNLQRETRTNTGYNISDSLKVIFENVYLGQWTWKSGLTDTPVTISKNAQGNFRAAGLPGATGAITIVVESDRQIELRNYPATGSHTTLVSQNGRLFRDMRPGINITFRKNSQ